MKQIEHNPDVLNCIANLSNDEVFTPPALVNQMLDLLPQELFSDPNSTFLDPFTKTAVFLREIVKRLDKGLENIIPDRQKRIDHILHKQVFGIAITELTSLLSRRTLYCSKFANGEHSISHFDAPEGNIWYQPMKHTWENGKCKFCGARQATYDRGEDAEQYAYPFIHVTDLKSIYNMKFSVICGNPPYQLSDGGDAADDAAMPIYQRFYEESIKCNPDFVSIIMPSKWMIGGRGLQSFRTAMTHDTHLEKIVDFENPFDCFPGIHIDGGVCYCLWNKNYNGSTLEYTYKPADAEQFTQNRKLGNEVSNIIIRDSRRDSIIQKVSNHESFSVRVSARKPFEIGTDLFNCSDNYPTLGLSYSAFPNSVKIYGVKGKKGGAKRVVGFIKRNSIKKNEDWINQYKLFISKSYSSDAITPPELIVSDKGEICTETFLVIGPFKTKEERDNCLEYTKTMFFKVLLYFGRGTMQVSREVFRFVPNMDFSKKWTDSELFTKFNFTDGEIKMIQHLIDNH